MKTKIATTFGLALMLTLGIFATMLALGMFSTSHVKADAVGVDFTASSEIPSATAKYVVSFTTDEDLRAGLDTITIKFDDDFSFPDTIDPAFVKITADAFTNMSGANTGSLVASPVDVTIALTGSPANDPEVTMTVPDMDPTSGNTGNQDILGSRAGAPTTVTVTFTQGAGISNPTADKDYEVGIWTSQDTTNDTTITDTVNIRKEVTVSSTSGARGKVFDVTGMAYSTGGVATVFIDGTDLNGDNDTYDTQVTGVSEVTLARDLNCDGDATDTGLTLNEQEVPNGVLDDGSAGVDTGDKIIGVSDASVSGGAFTASVTADTRFAVGRNAINVRDARGNIVTDNYQGGAVTGPGCYKVQIFTLIGSVTASPASAARGQTVTLTLSDWTNGALTAATFGGVAATLANGNALTTITVADNNAAIDVLVPATAPLGALYILVDDDGGSNRTISNYEVTGVPVTLLPATAVANQSVTISGQGFSTAANTVIQSDSGASGIIAGTADADDLTVDGITVVRDEIDVDSSGNVVFTVTLPNDANATRTAGIHTIRIEDVTGRVGEAILTVPTRSITLDPAESRRGSTVTVNGVGFVASTNVTIDYGTTASGLGIVSVVASASGDFSTTFDVPTTAAAAPIPSTNTVTATSAGGGAQNTATSSHVIPAAAIVVTPQEVSPGELVDISGTGFPGFSTVSSITVGGVTSTPVPGPATDEEGAFDTTAANVLVPQLALGTQAVVVTAGGVTANTSVTVVAAAAAVVVEAATEGTPSEVFSEAVTLDAALQVWGYTDGIWGFYDASLEADHPANDLGEVKAGDGVWMLNNTDADITVSILGRSLTLSPGWNLKGL